MKIYAQKIPNRKDLVKRIEELTRKKALYTFVPRCAYEIGEFSVEKDGCLTTTHDADEIDYRYPYTGGHDRCADQ